ncbi:MAG: choice-of-anchor J domain-containing protein [Chitinophagaceae bacterium]
MRKFYLSFLLALSSSFLFAQTPVPMASQSGLTYTESFADIANWTNGFAAGTGANRFGAVAVNATGTVPDGVRTTTATSTFATGTSGGVQKGSAQSPATQSIVFLATGATDNSSAVAIDFFMDFTGVNAGTLSFDWASINNSTGDRKGSLRVYYSTNGTSFTELSSAAVLNITNNAATSGSITTVALPAAFNNSSTARLRFYYYNGTGGSSGSRPKISIDNLTVTATSTGGSVSAASGTAAAEPATNGTFTINFSSATTASTDISFAYAGTATFGTDYTVSYSTGTTPSTTATGTLTVASGTSSVTVTITPVNDATAEGTETISLTLSSPTGGYSLGTAAASINLADDDAAPVVSVAAGVNAAEPATNGTFTLTLSGPAPAGGTTVSYTLGGTATLNTDYTDPQSGSILIPAGGTSGTITLNVTDDAVFESAETISITLNSATNGVTLGTSTATINLTSDDAAPGISLVTTYSQNFNTLAVSGTGNAWTDNSTIAGWYASRTTYNAGDGSSNAGALYSFGTGTATDRALGSVGSGSTTTVYYGARFTNNTGGPITALKVTYTGEQWRNGGNASAQTVNFAYQSGTTVTSLSTGSWTNVSGLNFTSPVTGTTAAALNGNLAGTNAAMVSYTITGLNIPAGNEIMIRWEDIDHSGSDHGLGVDDFTIEANPVDLAAPVITSLSPANGTTNVSTNVAASVVFNETVQKGTGNIVVKKTSDNSVVQTIDVTTAAVTVSGNTVSFSLSGLPVNTGLYITIDNGAIKDMSGNSFAGITNNSTWAFTTGTVFYTADFNTCTSALTDGFTQYSEVGAIVWACTTFGRDPAAPAGTTAYPNAVQINGFAGGTNVPNVDWLISPSFNLTGTTYPLLSFWSRTAFNGLPLHLKVSTDYVSGNPALATWTDINGKFPAQTSNVWTLSSNINLSAFKQSNVHFAFVYTSSDDEGARWTVDDVSISNSPVPPPPSLTVSATDIQFGFAAAGNSADKALIVTGNDLTGDITLTASPGFTLATSAGGPFTSSVTLTQATANNVPVTVYVRFSPAQNNQDFTGTITASTAGVSNMTVNLKGTSIDPVNTLEIVNWNIEWFGHLSMGPTNETQQQQNVKTIMQNIGADLYGLVEVVDESKLAAIVSQMPGYSYVICNYGSHTNTNESGFTPLGEAQKEAFVYKTSIFSNISTSALLSQGINSTADLNNPAYNYFASGRFPYMMKADVTLNGNTQTVRFVLIHAKANTSPTTTSYNRRKAGADTLQYTLNNLYPNDKIILLGDFNDDLDVTITDGIIPNTTSYSAFTTDNTHFFAPTLALSLAGKKSTVSYNDVIDHVMISDEMRCAYMPASANILTDVTSLVSNYGSTTTDHYPVFTRYSFDRIPHATISYSASPYCSNGGTAAVTLDGTMGGTYTSTTGLSINASTGAIDLGASAAGSYTVTYTIAASGGCPEVIATAPVSITAGPSATIGYGGSVFCQNGGTAGVTQTGTAGGTYSSTTGLTINATTGTITPGTSTPGTYTVTYTIAASGGCPQVTATAPVTIVAMPAATISYNGSPYCQNIGIATVARTGAAGGTYSSTAGLTINAATGTITLGSSTPGVYLVTYTIGAAGGCPTYTTTTTITITPIPSAAISYAGSPYCNTGIATVARTGNAGGTYSAVPAGLSINASTGAIDLTASTPGTYTVRYSVVAAGGCAAYNTTASVTINGASIAPTGATASVTTLCGPGTTNLSVTGGVLGSGASWKWYSYSCGGTVVGTGSTLNNVPVNATNTYYVRAEGTCNYTTCASVPVTVNTQPTVTLSASPYASLLPGLTTTLTATATPANPGYTYAWTRGGTPVGGATGNTLAVTIDQLGAYAVTVTGAGGCAATSNTVTIRDSASGRLFIGPNPNDGQFKVRYYSSSATGARKLLIYDSHGALVYSRLFPAATSYSSMDVDIRRHGKGLYIIALEDNNGKVIAKGKVEIL